MTELVYPIVGALELMLRWYESPTYVGDDGAECYFFPRAVASQSSMDNCECYWVIYLCCKMISYANYVM